MEQYIFPIGCYSSNCYAIVDESSSIAAIIDPGEFYDKIIDFLTDKKIKVKYILLTHGHLDHILGVYDLKNNTGARVAIHKGDEECLKDEIASLAYNIRPGMQKYLEPDLLLEDGMNIDIGQVKLNVIHTPGHTKGSVCFVCNDEHKIFTVDTLFYHCVGRTDFPGGSMPELLDSLKRISSLKGDFIIYAGHNRTSTLDEERLHNRYLRNLV